MPSQKWAKANINREYQFSTLIRVNPENEKKLSLRTKECGIVNVQLIILNEFETTSGWIEPASHQIENSTSMYCFWWIDRNAHTSIEMVCKMVRIVELELRAVSLTYRKYGGKESQNSKYLQPFASLCLYVSYHVWLYEMHHSRFHVPAWSTNLMLVFFSFPATFKPHISLFSYSVYAVFFFLSSSFRWFFFRLSIDIIITVSLVFDHC